VEVLGKRRMVLQKKGKNFSQSWENLEEELKEKCQKIYCEFRRVLVSYKNYF